ncbi:hypothetical protein BHE74_00030759 [Ensete ventricosum]|nr:hypothetical protein GW17_00037694 [Ensete ventricosum]RWW62135.1 hypothetical protein BHE74_00030759 [Ensete ventricosum]
MLSLDARFRHLHRYRRRLLVALLSHRTFLAVLWTVLFSAVVVWQSGAVARLGLFRRRAPPPRPCPRLRPTVFNLSDFGGVGDGVTLNTQAFEKAVEAIMEFGGSGGGQLNVPPGIWLTGPFNLTSHMTLFLAEGAVIVGIEWTVYADSCEDMVIENSYISVGDDGIAIKSGWDQYGIAYGRPSTNILVKNVVLRSKMSAGVSIGSEMSGGISNITFENILVWDSRRGVRIKTAPGRGGYIHNISYSNLTFNNLSVGIVIKTDYNEHPDDGFDPKAIPTIRNLTFRGVYGRNVRIPVRIQGSKEILVRGISFQDMQVGLSYKKKRTFQCSYAEGYVVGPIFPAPCDSLDRYDENGRLVKRSIIQNGTDTDYDI